MEFKEAKNKFVQTWGALGSQWGINKTMAQIHALLMVSHEAVSMEDIMEETLEIVKLFEKTQQPDESTQIS